MVRRLIFVFFVLVVLFFAISGKSCSNIVDACNQPNGEVFVYCKKYQGQAVSNGTGVIVQTDCNNYLTCLQQACGVDGITIVWDKSAVDLDTLFKKLNVVVHFAQQLQGAYTIYGYSNKVRGGVYVDGVKINVQVAVTDSQVHVGSPILLGSY